MIKIRAELVGRDPKADITFNHATVSRKHAEIVFMEDGRLYVTDCVSTSGTRVFRDGQWLDIRQDFVKSHEALRFGDFEIVADKILSYRSGAAKQNKNVESELDASRGLQRDPSTGEIQEKD